MGREINQRKAAIIGCGFVGSCNSIYLNAESAFFRTCFSRCRF